MFPVVLFATGCHDVRMIRRNLSPPAKAPATVDGPLMTMLEPKHSNTECSGPEVERHPFVSTTAASAPRKPLNTVITHIPPSGIRRFFDIAQQMENVISLGIGEPDYVTPL